jgi:hypothetical protein
MTRNHWMLLGFFLAIAGMASFAVAPVPARIMLWALGGGRQVLFAGVDWRGGLGHRDDGNALVVGRHCTFCCNWRHHRRVCVTMECVDFAPLTGMSTLEFSENNLCQIL